MSVKMIAVLLCVVAQLVLVLTAPISDNGMAIKSEEMTISAVEDKEIFRIPRSLKIGDHLNVSGYMKTDREKFTISLVAGNGDKPDYANVRCQVKLDFPTEASSKDMITVNTIVNGQFTELDENTRSTEMFQDLQFAIGFTIEKNKIVINLKESSTLNDCELQHSTDYIHYLTLGGDVHKVEALHFQLK